MALKRIYIFDGDQLRQTRVSPSDAKAYDNPLRTLGITNWDIALLFVLRLGHSITSNEVAAALALDRPAVAAIVRVLEFRGAISLKSQADRRFIIEITDEGRDILMKGLDQLVRHRTPV